MSERVYGKITIADKNWVIEAEPQVIVKLKRMFPNAKQRRSKKLWLSMTAENGMDIEWVLTRWPMQVDPDVKESLLSKKETYETMRENVMNILSGKTVLTTNRVPKREPRPYQQQAADLAYVSKTLLLTDDLGLGKGQPPETPILTPTGWKTYKEIKVGDYVVGSNGKGTKVTGIFPKGVQQLYRITFSDKTSTITDGEHLWQVQNNVRQNKGKVNNHLILSTQEMYEGKRKTVRVKSGTGYKMERDYSFDSYYLYKNNASKWSIPQVSPVIYRKQEPLPLDPYILGAILGDGSTVGETITFTTADPEIASYLQNIEVKNSKFRKRKNKYEYAFTKIDRNEKNYLLDLFNGWGLKGKKSNVKFIPSEYMTASPTSRLAMIQGLMDTDGTVGPKGVGAIFTTTSEQLANQIADLARSLGGIARISPSQKYYIYKGVKKKGLPSFNVNIKLPEGYEPFRLKRKFNSWKKPTKYFPRKFIRNIEKCGMGESICISVQAKDRLYVTEGFNVTHNSFSSILSLAHKDTLPALIVCPPNLTEQWQNEINKSFDMETHVLQKVKPYNILKEENKLRKKTSKKLDIEYIPLERNPDIIISSYSKLTGWVEFLSEHIKTVIYDEVQELRRMESQKHQSSTILSQNATMRIGLSATPIANSGIDVHTILSALSGGQSENPLGDRNEFIKEWGKSSYGQKIRINDPAALALEMKDMGILLRREKDEVGLPLDKPLTSVIPVVSDLKSVAKHSITALELAKQILDEDTDPKQRFTASGEFDIQMRSLTALAKAPAAAGVAEMLLHDSTDNLVVFAFHRGVYDIFNDRLAKFNPVMYTGSENPQQKQANLNKFLNGESKVIMISLKSAAGLDGLQNVCSTGLVAELPWTPLDLEQALGRLLRPGQEKVVSWNIVSSTFGIDPIMEKILGIKSAELKTFNSPNKKQLLDSNVLAQERTKLIAKNFIEQQNKK